MLELTREECEKLEESVINEICGTSPSDDPYVRLRKVIAEISVRATITTIREYERMKSGE